MNRWRENKARGKMAWDTSGEADSQWKYSLILSILYNMLKEEKI